MKKKPLTKEELIARLKANSANTERVEKKEEFGAMCYSPLPRYRYIERHVNCEICGADIEYSVPEWDKDSEAKYIRKVVKQISQLGYEASVQLCCEKCARQFIDTYQANEKPKCVAEFDLLSVTHCNKINFLFSFKTKDSDTYHKCIANDSSQYDLLYMFLCNGAVYDDVLALHIPDAKDILRYMTGIKFDEQD